MGKVDIGDAPAPITNTPIQEISLKDFLRAFYKDDKETVYLRVFDDRDSSDNTDKYRKNYEVELRFFDGIMATLQGENMQNHGVFFVVNGGGQKKEKVIASKSCSAQFMEIDEDENGNHVPFDEQLEEINAFPLRPSIIVRTRKSLHCYWLLKDGDIKRYRGIQEKLIKRFHSDPKIKDENRVMRLPYFNHCKSDPVRVELIHFEPDRRYTQDELEAVLPEASKESSPTPDQHSKLSSMITAYKVKESEEWLDKWLELHNIPTVKQYTNNSKALVKYNLTEGCPWKENHTVHSTDDSFGNAILTISSEGIIGFSCAHSHCNDKHWKDFRLLYEPDAYESKLPAFHITKKGLIINDVRNAKIFLDFILQGHIRYNSFTNRIEVYGSVPWETENNSVRPWNDADTSNALMLANEYYLKSKNNLIDAICIVANENKYHPIKQYLESLSYSGDGYIRKLAVEYMGCEDSEYTYECMKLLLLAMVQRVYYPGCKYDYVLIFVGPQGSYKSTFWKTLARDDEWFSDSIDSFSDRKKLGELIQGKWLVELGEMSALKKSEIESIKAAVTSQCDSYREAFMRFRSDFPRTTVFVGTTNNKTFLRDATGNRRFLVLPINSENRTKDLFSCDTRDQDFENALAEALHIFREATKNGKPMPLVLPKSVMAEAEKLQNNANVYEEWTGIIAPWLDDAVKTRGKRYTCGLDIWHNCFNRDQASWTNKEAKRINEILDSFPNWEKSPSVRITMENAEGTVYFEYHGRGYKYVGDEPDQEPIL